MKQIVHSEIGNPAEVLSVQDVAPAHLKVDEVRVKVLATPIHPSNLLQISGQYGVMPKLPAIPGSEGVGRVCELGEAVEGIILNQLVLLPATSGTWRQEIVGPSGSFIPLPDNADVQQLSMLTVNPLTAYTLLHQFVDLKQGAWLIQSAANSAVGTYLIQLARQRGFKTVNIVRRESAMADVESVGGDVVLLDGEDLPARVAAATNDAPLMLAIDAVGGETFSRLIQCLAAGGTITCYGSLSMQPPMLSSMAVIFNDIRVRGFWLSKWFELASTAEKQSAFGEVIALIAQGVLKTPIDTTFSLEQISDAVTRAAESGRNGKVLLLPNP